MKKLLLFFSLLTAAGLSAQTATSVQNGNWTNPLTWSCGCVPLPGYTVTINTDVTLNTGFAYTTGSITVNAGASLMDDATGRDLWLNGGSFTNNGTVDVRYFLVQSGTFANSGTITAHAIANYVSFTNSGTFLQVDSMYNNAAITNNGTFSAIDSLTNAGLFTNNGNCTYNQFTNTGQYFNNDHLTLTDITNTGTLTNADTVDCLNSMWNTGSLVNQPGSYILIHNGFLNDDPAQHDAVFNNNGRMQVLDSWYNMDTTRGVSGSIIVQDTSYNSGYLKETFDFCDLTPPATAPYIDFNLGSVAAGITWCINTTVTDPGAGTIVLYPNPANEQLFIQAPGAGFTLALFNAEGMLLGTYRDARVIDISRFPAGLYFLSFDAGNQHTIQKLQITR